MCCLRVAPPRRSRVHREDEGPLAIRTRDAFLAEIPPVHVAPAVRARADKVLLRCGVLGHELSGGSVIWAFSVALAGCMSGELSRFQALISYMLGLVVTWCLCI